MVALQGGNATARVLSGASAVTRATTILADAVASPSVSQLNDTVWTNFGAWQQSQSSIFQFLTSLAQSDIIYQVNADAGLPDASLKTALTELIRQMTANSTTIQGSTVSAGAQTAIGSPVGNPVVAISMKNAFGQTQQVPFPETLRFTVRTDSQSGGTARSEQIQCQGQVAVQSKLSYLWPGGSNAAASVNLIDAQLNNNGTMLVNGSGEVFTTANVADNWTVGAGVAGTNFFAAGSGYTLTNGFKITGDVGGTLTSISQKFNTAPSTIVGIGGTSATLLPSTQYCVNLFTKVSSVPAAGVLEVALVDGSGTILQDGQGVNSSFTIALTGETTSFAPHSGFLRTPAVLPASASLRVRTSTAIDSTKSVIWDDIAFAPATLLYAGGPSFAVFAANTNPVKGDAWTSAISVTAGAMASWFERLFGLNGLGLVIPFAASSPTASDSLIS